MLKTSIVRISGSYYPAKKMGGAATADYEIDKWLSKFGHEVLVLSTMAGLKNSDIVNAEIENDIKVKFFQIYGNLNFFIAPKLFVYFIFKMLTSIKFRNSHFIFSGTWGVTSIFTMLVCKLAGCNYSVIPHGSLYPELVEKRKPKIKKMLAKLLTPILNSAKFVHYTVNAEKKAAEDIHTNQNNAIVIPLGLDYKNFYTPSSDEINSFRNTYNIPNNKKIILFVGRLNWKKGLDKLLRSLHYADSSCNFELVCIGPEDPGYLKELREQLSLSEFERMNYIGPLYEKDLSIAYASADVFALTSYSENFAMTIIEASYYNNAIFMTDKVGVSEFFNSDNAIISTLEDDDINQKLLSLLTNQSLINHLSCNSKIICDRFDINNTVGDLSENIDK